MTLPGCPALWPGAGKSSKRFVPIAVRGCGYHGRGRQPRGGSGPRCAAALGDPLPGVTIMGAVGWGGHTAKPARVGRLPSRLGKAMRSHPAPQPSLKREVESNYWGLKRGGKGRGEKKLKGCVCREENLPPELPIIKFSARSSRCAGGERLHHEGRPVSSNEHHDSAKASELLQTCSKLCSGSCL